MLGLIPTGTVLPRYRNPVTITDPETGEKVVFEDDYFGRPYNFDRSNFRPVTPSLQAQIIRSIRENLDVAAIDGSRIGH